MARKHMNPNKVGTTRLNPLFHPMSRHIGSPRGALLKRGYIVHAPDLPDAPSRGYRGRIDFQYNPASIGVTHNVFLGDTAPGTVPDGTNPDALNTGAMVGIGDLELPLLFDRTYDLWDSSKADTLAGTFGAYVDVLAFYHFLGMTEAQVDGPDFWQQIKDIRDGKKQSDSGNRDDTQVWAQLYPVKPPNPTYVYLYIGDKLKYYGVVGSISVSYTHFNHKMVPLRAATSVGMRLLADPNATGEKVHVDTYEPIPSVTTPPGLPNNPFPQ